MWTYIKSYNFGFNIITPGATNGSLQNLPPSCDVWWPDCKSCITVCLSAALFFIIAASPRHPSGTSTVRVASTVQTLCFPVPPRLFHPALFQHHNKQTCLLNTYKHKYTLTAAVVAHLHLVIL